MKSKKNKLVLVIASICLFGIVAIAKPSTSLLTDLITSVKDSTISNIFFSTENKTTNQSKNNKVSENKQDVPDRIIYLILFNNLVGLKTQSEKLQSEGKYPINYLEIYQKEANINGIQSQYLFQTAQNCLDQITIIDAEAKTIIDDVRARFPEGEVASPSDIPPPPQELAELQKQKDETLLGCRDELKNFFGDAKFIEFDLFVKQKITPQIKHLKGERK